MIKFRKLLGEEGVKEFLVRKVEVAVTLKLIANGETADAALRLIRKMGGKVLECAFIIDLLDLLDLLDLCGRKRLKQHGYTVHKLVEFEGK